MQRKAELDLARVGKSRVIIYAKPGLVASLRADHGSCAVRVTPCPPCATRPRRTDHALGRPGRRRWGLREPPAGMTPLIGGWCRADALLATPTPHPPLPSGHKRTGVGS